MKRRTDEEISAPLYAYDADIRAQYGCFAGVDEAGRGPLCGPVCVAACILDPEAPVYGINDSKKLSEKKREALFDQIVEKALAYKIVFVGPDIIDRDNILNATMGGMRQAVEGLDIVPNLVLVDGSRIPDGLTMPAQPVVKPGDKVFVGQLQNAEIDFVAERDGQRAYIQVCYLLQSDETIEREFGNLLKIKDNFQKIVVCMDDIATHGVYDGIKCIHIKDFLKSPADI